MLEKTGLTEDKIVRFVVGLQRIGDPPTAKICAMAMPPFAAFHAIAQPPNTCTRTPMRQTTRSPN